MINLPLFEVRAGLRTKFYRPHHRKDTLVTISWLDIETPDSLVAHVMSYFGNLKSNIQWVKFKKEENESELASLLNNILSGERQVWMEINKAIPSYGVIDGKKVKMYHPGQRGEPVLAVNIKQQIIAWETQMLNFVMSVAEIRLVLTMFGMIYLKMWDIKRGWRTKKSWLKKMKI